MRIHIHTRGTHTRAHTHPLSHAHTRTQTPEGNEGFYSPNRPCLPAQPTLRSKRKEKKRLHIQTLLLSTSKNNSWHDSLSLPPTVSTCVLSLSPSHCVYLCALSLPLSLTVLSLSLSLSLCVPVCSLSPSLSHCVLSLSLSLSLTHTHTHTLTLS